MEVKMESKKFMNRKKNKKLPFVAGILLVLAVSLAWTLSNQGISAETVAAERGGIQKYVEETGEVKCKDSITVYLEGNGLIQSISADVGQQVKKGDVLLTMDKSQLEIQRMEADEKINEIEANIRGSDVKNYASRVEKARIAADQANETYNSALNDFNDTKTLYDAGAVSREELDQKEMLLKNALSALNTARLSLQETKNDIPENIQAAYRAQLKQAVLNKENIELNLKKQDILSPMSGVILAKKVEVNEFGMPGTAAFVIGNPEDVEMESRILAEDAAGIKVGDKAEITARTEDRPEIEGTVVKIAPTAEDETSSLGVKQKKVAITIKPSESRVSLKPGSEVDVRVITETKNDVIVVPTGAVFDYQGKTCVFTVEGGKAVLRTVNRGIRNESFAEITNGLEEGEMVLSSPDNSIEEGMRIKAGPAEE